jgi:hypothetical protein
VGKLQIGQINLNRKKRDFFAFAGCVGDAVRLRTDSSLLLSLEF